VSAFRIRSASTGDRPAPRRTPPSRPAGLPLSHAGVARGQAGSDLVTADTRIAGASSMTRLEKATKTVNVVADRAPTLTVAGCRLERRVHTRVSPVTTGLAATARTPSRCSPAAMPRCSGRAVRPAAFCTSPGPIPVENGAPSHAATAPAQHATTGGSAASVSRPRCPCRGTGIVVPCECCAEACVYLASGEAEDR
jgi:hypothetical protein